MVRASISALPFAASLAIFGPSEARACACTSVAAPAEAANEADAAFVGVVEEVRVPLLLRAPIIRLVDTPLSFVFATEPTIRTRLRIETRYRGALGSEVEIDSGDGLCCNCTPGRVFAPGERWLVAAFEHDGELRVSTCRPPVSQRQRPQAFAAALEALGPGDPTPHARPRWTPKHDTWWPVVTVPLALAAVAVARKARSRHACRGGRRRGMLGHARSSAPPT